VRWKRLIGRKSWILLEFVQRLDVIESVTAMPKKRKKSMVIITFPDEATEKKAPGFLLGRFSGIALKSGEHIVPEAAMAALARQDISFTVHGKASYEIQVAALRSAVSGTIQWRARRSGQLLGEAVKEIVNQFGAVSYFKNAAEGYWQHDNSQYRDDLGLLVANVPDTAKNRKWMKAYKTRRKEKLQQLEIWMVSYVINIE
jgi:hypothetical protein